MSITKVEMKDYVAWSVVIVWRWWKVGWIGIYFKGEQEGCADRLEHRCREEDDTSLNNWKNWTAFTEMETKITEWPRWSWRGCANLLQNSRRWKGGTPLGTGGTNQSTHPYGITIPNKGPIVTILNKVSNPCGYKKVPCRERVQNYILKQWIKNWLKYPNPSSSRSL